MNLKKVFYSLLIIFISFVSTQAQVSVELLKKHVYSLADDSMQGRNTSTAGGKMAANYIAKEFKTIGLATKTNDNSYLQSFTYYAGKEYTKNNYLKIDKTNFLLHEDYYAISYSANGILKGKIVKVNQGLELPKQKSDYDQLNVSGCVVMIDIGYPTGFDPHSENSKYADILNKN